MNTFSLKFINLETSRLGSRRNTTYAQLQSVSCVGILYLPSFKVILSTDGQDWLKFLEGLSALRDKPFYSDAQNRPVEFSITFDFGYSNLSHQLKLDFMAKANLYLVEAIASNP